MRVNVTPGQVYAQLEALGRVSTSKMIQADELTDEEMASIAGLFESWQPDKVVKALDIRRYNNLLYECIQSHTTQVGWEPPTTPALWKLKSAPGIIPAWIQPTGAHDAYAIDDQVTHVGKTWVSGIAANTTVPGENPAFNWWTEVV